MKVNFFLVAFLLSFKLFAQFDDGIEPPPTPIDEDLNILFILSILVAFYFLTRYKFKKDSHDETKLF